MNIPAATKPAVWGAVGGAIALAIVGFSWGGWVTGSTADKVARERASLAVVSALAPICVDKFQRSSDAASNLTELKKVDSWGQGDFVEKGGWATVVGANPSDQVSAVAKACAQLLSAT